MNILEDIGLNKNEALVYQTLLNKGELIASQVAETTKLNRPNAYAILKSLTQKGVIEEFDKKKKLTYRVDHPQKLLDFMQNKRQEQEEKYKELSLIMPKLIDDYEIVMNKPGVSYLEGFDGFKRVYQDILKTKKDVYVMVSKYARERKEIREFMTIQITKQKERGVKVKAIRPEISKSSLGEAEYIERAKHSLVEIKSMPPSFLLYSQVLIYGDTVAITSFKNKFITTWIQNKDIAQTMRTIFMTMWDSGIGEKIA